MNKKILYITIFSFIILILIAFMLFLVGIKYENKSSADLVLTTTRPLTLATERIFGDVPGVAVKEITSGFLDSHSCFHDFSITAEQSVDFENAKVLVINGASMEPFVTKIINNNKKMIIIDSSEKVNIIKDKDGRMNPWVWMSVPNYANQVSNIASKLAKIFMNYREKILNNSDFYVKSIESIYEKWKPKFEKFKGRNVLAFGDEFDYFLEDLGLNPVHLVERHVHGLVSAKDVNNALNKIENGNHKFYLTAGNKPDFLNNVSVFPVTLSLVKSSSDFYEEDMENNFKILYEVLSKYYE